MRPPRYVIAALLLAAAAAPLSAQKQLQLLATISDPNGAEVATLDPKDVKVVENGKELTVSAVQAVRRTPKLQILIDNGLGIPAASLGELRKGLKDLLAALPEGLEVTLVTTAPQPRMLERATMDRGKLLQAVDRLTPDGGSGRFVESLSEAAERAEKDKDADAAYTFFSIGTYTGDIDTREGETKKLWERVQKNRITIHVVLLNTKTGGQVGGTIQSEVGQQLARGTGGRFETIAVPNRLATLLPEYGMQMATALGPGAKQFRITVERADAGPVGAMGFSVAGGRIVSNPRIASTK